MPLYSTHTTTFQISPRNPVIHFVKGTPPHSNATRFLSPIFEDAVTSMYSKIAIFLSLPPSYQLSPSKHYAWPSLLPYNTHLQISTGHNYLPAILPKQSVCFFASHNFSNLEYSTRIFTPFSNDTALRFACRIPHINFSDRLLVRSANFCTRPLKFCILNFSTAVPKDSLFSSYVFMLFLNIPPNSFPRIPSKQTSRLSYLWPLPFLYMRFNSCISIFHSFGQTFNKMAPGCKTILAFYRVVTKHGSQSKFPLLYNYT